MLVFAFDDTLLTFSVNAPSIAPLLALPLTIAPSEVPPWCGVRVVQSAPAGRD